MQHMTYQQALDYLYSFIDTEHKLPRRSPEFNLPRTAALLRALGDPQRAFQSVIVAGTKGKGSTAALLEAIVRHAGLRSGLWTSPHLHSYRERIQVDRRLISQEELACAVTALKPLVDVFDQEQHGHPTVFELGFVTALRYFAEHSVELAVLEVGLGGRYDSANVVTPVLSIITSISYDHMRILGDRLSQIAYEKAGIIKPGVPAITIPQHPEAMAEIERVAGEVGAPLWVAVERRPTTDQRPATGDQRRATSDQPSAANFQSLASSSQSPASSPQPLEEGELAYGVAFDPFERYRGPTTTALRGVFQRENARLATGAALLLRDGGLPISDAAIAAGLATTWWPGRLEIIGDTPPIVLDGAHNGDSAHKLVQSLDEVFPNRRVVLVLGTSHDKDIPRIAAELVPIAGALVLTHSRHPRALIDLDALAAAAEPLLRGAEVPVVRTDDVPEALDEARALARPEDVICVTGSLFVVAAAREALGLGEPD